jgi:hypothetical protein
MDDRHFGSATKFLEKTLVRAAKFTSEGGIYVRFIIVIKCQVT